jgi:hypothetical protein
MGKSPIQILNSSFEFAGVKRELQEDCCKGSYWKRLGPLDEEVAPDLGTVEEDCRRDLVLSPWDGY